MKLRPAAPGLTPRDVLKLLSGIQMVDVHIPIRDGRLLILPRYTEPSTVQAMVLSTLTLTLPPQPPPRIRAGDVELPTAQLG